MSRVTDSCGPRCANARHSRRGVLASALALTASATAITNSPLAFAQTPVADQPIPPYIPEPDTELLDPIAGPLTPEPVTFRVLTARSDEVTDYDDNAFTRWLNAQTNVQVNWNLVPEDDMQSKLNVMLSSGDVPEIIFGFVNPSQLLLYGSQGIFLRLNELIDEHAPRAKKLLEMYPVLRDVVTDPDGNIYCMPGYGECFHCSFNQKLWIYQPWLDKLGLSMPTTTDELETVLTAFKTQDPNGNGEADEVPLSGSLGDLNTQLPSFLMNAFIFNPNEPFLIVVDGKVTPIYVTPEWKEGLAYMRRLYAAGLIDPGVFTQDEDQVQRLGNNPDTVLLGSVLGGSAGSAVSIDKTPGARWTEYAPVPPLKGPNGVQYAAWNPYLPAYAAAPITKACSDPALAVAWVDSLYWQEATLRQDRGPRDEDWRYALEGELDADGNQAIWKLLVIHADPTNQSWQGTGPLYYSSNLFSGIAVDQEAIDLNLEALLHNTTKNLYQPFAEPMEMALPPLALTQDQAFAIADPEATIVQYVKQMMTQFVRGDADLDAGWDEYVNTVSSMGLDGYIQAYQEAYDAKYGA